MMRLSEVLEAEWRPAFGCTEPAAVAWAASMAAEQARGEGPIEQVRLVVDPRTYKNCYAVGIPNSEHRTGILWALAIGAELIDPSLGLEVFTACTPAILARAQALLDRRGVEVEVDAGAKELRIDATVRRDEGLSRTCGRAVLAREHTRVALLESDGRVVGGTSDVAEVQTVTVRSWLAERSLEELLELARTATPEDRQRLREGAAMNLAIAEYGVSLLPSAFIETEGRDLQTRSARLVSSGVFARMSGVSMPVMSLAGSGNKGIASTVPVLLWGREHGCEPSQIDAALAISCLVTSAATERLGTLSAICGAANASGLGVAAALVLLQGGDASALSRAVANMVGNVAGMICDGAKIGCAMKSMTGVEAAFRSAALALAGIGIPPTDGIVGASGEASLANLGCLAQIGMASVDREILRIMQGKLGA
ncbi:MAG TPA: L-serine ammonia-lyase, iron-sulfur-dependent, subunit alpha [Holophaga sp.]|nr:L-serine ammonia-lyase, iron-sulfur-dependent, subunit alpha [Holophaga sp.]